MFGEITDIPIVQVSLPGDPAAEHSAALGKALTAVRDQGYTVICIGQGMTRRDYSMIDDFDAIDYYRAINKAVTADDSLKEVLKLQEEKVFPRIPTRRDYLPLVVAAAAAQPGEKGEVIDAGSDTGEKWREYKVDHGYEGPMVWGLFEWK